MIKEEYKKEKKVSDALVRAATSTNLTLKELGRAFALVTPIALKIGVDLEELNAIFLELLSQPRRGFKMQTNTIGINKQFEKNIDKYRMGIKELEVEFEKKKKEFAVCFAEKNNPVKIGDFVGDEFELIKVKLKK